MKENKNKIIISVIAVLLIAAIVAGGTYAYWSWTSNTAQRTNVGFTVDAPNMSASIEGNGTSTVSSLAPTTCTNSTYAMKKTVAITYTNATSVAAKLTANLKVTDVTAGVSTPSSTELGKLNYALTTSSTSCAAGTGNLTGTFAGKLTAGSTVLTLDLDVPANTAEKTVTYYLYVWLDSTYTHQNVGGVNSDPMQNLSFTLQWDGSMVQVAG